MKQYCFECKCLQLERDKEGRVTGLKLCPKWSKKKPIYHADFQPVCELFENKIQEEEKCRK